MANLFFAMVALPHLSRAVVENRENRRCIQASHDNYPLPSADNKLLPSNKRMSMLPYNCWELYKTYEEHALKFGSKPEPSDLLTQLLLGNCDAAWDGSSLQISPEALLEAEKTSIGSNAYLVSGSNLDEVDMPKWPVLLSEKLEQCETKYGSDSKSCDYIRKWFPQ